MKFRTISAILLMAASTAVLADTTSRRVNAPNNQDEKLSQPAAPARTPVITATVAYTGTLPATPTFNRPFSCAALSGVGTSNSFHVQPFSVDTAGSYSIEVLSTTMPGADTVLVLYLGAFDPASPLTNCIAINDDIGGGSFLSRITENLNPATVYTAVTTSYDPGEVGDVSNQITGPGGITLGGSVGPAANLGITKSAPDGIANGGTYIYRLGASNTGPDDGTGVTVTDVLPAGVSFVSSTCGATASGQTVTWTIGALANGGSASCDLTVNRAAMTCSAVSNTATIAGTLPDPNTANNSATHSNGGGDLVTDGSFEAAGAPAWTQASSNFGSPLCDDASCGNGAGTAGPRTGLQWIWFGGAGANLESGSVEQAVTIPTGANSLTFGYWLGACGTGGAADFVRLTVGGTELWRRDATSAECAAAGYTVATVDISALATGASRVIRFEATSGTAGDNSNFNIDDVSIASSPVCVAPANADLGLTQSVTPVGSQSIGSSVNLVWSVQNNGPGAASAVVVSATLPAQLSFTSSTCGATASGQVVSWNVGALANAANATCTVTTSIAQTGGITVNATVSSATSDPVSANNSASGSLAGAPAPAARPAVVPTLSHLGLLALMLSVLALAGFSLSRRSS